MTRLTSNLMSLKESMSRQSFTAKQINDACYVDVKGNKPVFESLAKNPKVNYENRRFSYKSKHNVRDQKELLRLIRTFAEGIAVADLKDAYPTVMDDLQSQKSTQDVSQNLNSYILPYKQRQMSSLI